MSLSLSLCACVCVCLEPGTVVVEYAMEGDEEPLRCVGWRGRRSLHLMLNTMEKKALVARYQHLLPLPVTLASVKTQEANATGAVEASPEGDETAA